MPPAYEILLLNTAIPQIQAAQSGDTYVVPRDIAFSAALTLSAGTANGVPYLNASKVLTTGSALTFDGSNLGLGQVPAVRKFEINAIPASISQLNGIRMQMDGVATSASEFLLGTDSGGVPYASIRTGNDGNSYMNFLVGSGPTERMRISSDGTFRVKGAGTAGSTDAVQFSGSAPASTLILDASGNLGVGTTSIAAVTGFSSSRVVEQIGGVSGYGQLRLGNDAGTMLDHDNSGTTTTTLRNLYGATSASALVQIQSGTITFGTGTSYTERARITSGGYFKASNDGTYLNTAGTYHEINQTANDNVLFIRSTDTAYSVDGVQLRFSRNTTNNSFYVLSYYNATAAAYKFRVADSGDVTNTNGTYGTISDAKMKTDIVDAGSQWSDIKALRFRKFKMKDDPSGLVQLGVVAQEVELTSPGLVDEHADKDAEGNDLGTTTKSVKTSVLLMKAAVALQEAMARIEKLEAEVAALKGA